VTYSHRASSVRIDMSHVEEIIGAHLEQLAEWSARNNGDYTQEQAVKDTIHFVSEIEKAQKELASHVEAAKDRVPNWSGSVIMLRPLLNEKNPVYGEEDVKDFRTSYVYVDKTPDKNSPSFMTYIAGSKIEVEDVLDAGDSDFFNNPEIESDYFQLVKELRHPGSTARAGEKVLFLYTARPTKDRHLYEHARSVPTNIFLSTSYDEAEGYARDMGERDIWRVRIKLKHLVETLDRGRLKNYQAVAPGSSVPVESIELVS